MSGLLLPEKVEIPRIQKLESSYPGSPERWIPMTPLNFPAKLLDKVRVVPNLSSVGLMVSIDPIIEAFF